MENKKKKNIKKTTTKKPNTKKPNTNAKAKVHKPVKKVTPKKAAPKKVQNKVAPKPVTKTTPKKEVVKPVEPKKETTEEKLEKTMVFDGTQRKNLEQVVNKLGEDKVVLKDKVIKRRPINKYIIYVLSALIVITIIGTALHVRKVMGDIKKNEEPRSNEVLDPTMYRHGDESEVGTGTNKDKSIEAQRSNIKTISLDDFEVKVAEGENMMVLISSRTCSFSLRAEEIYDEVLRSEKKTMRREERFAPRR